MASVPPPVGLAAALDSHRSANPTVNCAWAGSRLHTPCENHPEAITPPPPPVEKLFSMKPVPDTKTAGTSAPAL